MFLSTTGGKEVREVLSMALGLVDRLQSGQLIATGTGYSWLSQTVYQCPKLSGRYAYQPVLPSQAQGRYLHQESLARFWS